MTNTWQSIIESDSGERISVDMRLILDFVVRCNINNQRLTRQLKYMLLLRPTIAGINKIPRLSFYIWGRESPHGLVADAWVEQWIHRALTRAPFRLVHTVLSRDYSGRGRRKEREYRIGCWIRCRSREPFPPRCSGDFYLRAALEHVRNDRDEHLRRMQNRLDRLEINFLLAPFSSGQLVQPARWMYAAVCTVETDFALYWKLNGSGLFVRPVNINCEHYILIRRLRRDLSITRSPKISFAILTGGGVSTNCSSVNGVTSRDWF